MAQGDGTRRVGRRRDVSGAALQNPHAEARSVVLDGHEVRYWCYDAGRAPKPMLVMVHGFRGDHHGLQLVADRLRDRYRVVVPDLPGFGRSAPLPDRSHDVAGYADVLRRFAEALSGAAARGRAADDDGAGPGHASGAPAAPGILLLGHSFGSVVAAHCAAAHPGLVERLVLVNPICRPALEGDQALLSRLAATYYRLGRALPRGPGRRLLSSRLVTDAMSELMTKSGDPEVRGYVRQQHRAYFSPVADRDVLLEAYRASISHTVAEVAMRLTMPVLLVVGAEDELGSVPDQRRMASWIPRHRLEVLEGVGHLIHYEAPGRTAELVHDFLAAPAPRAAVPPDRLPSERGAPGAAPRTESAPITGRRRTARRGPRR